MKQKRKIAVFTGNRAEYGLQTPIIRAVDRHPDLELALIVSGAHLDPHFGNTLAEIESDGFSIAAEVKIDMPEDTLLATAHAIGSGVISMAGALEEIRPDIVLVYADRFEGFAAVIASTQMGLPTGHIEGGDITDGGALDDSVRHAMTKLSHLHFTTNQQASNRLMGMGEEAWRVHTTGFPMIDLIKDGDFTPRAEVLDRYGLDPERPIVIFTQHSVTTEADDAIGQIGPSLEAMGRLSADGVQVILTYPNNDAGGRRIIAELEAFAARDQSGIQLHPSLGRRNYHGLLALASDQSIRVACVGNSSSGIKETPAFGCPTVNIGSRQLNRLRSTNVVDAGYDTDAVEAAVRTCLFDEQFRRVCKECENPYGLGDTGERVAQVLADIVLGKTLLQKKMTLQGVQENGWFK